MSDTAQTILSVGVALFLVLIATPGVVWAFRCNTKSHSYRFPIGLGIAAPFLGLLYLAIFHWA
jgi:Na+-translocating ferredoxin:NAD+ oxidoreductase RnfE subunit